MSLCSKNRFVSFESSANIIAFIKLEALGKLITYIKNYSGPRIDLCGTSHVTFCSFLLVSLLCKFLILIIRKKYSNENIIVHFEYFFTCQYIKTVWLAANLNEIKTTNYDKIFSHIK